MTNGAEARALRSMIPNTNGVSGRSLFTPVLEDVQVQIEFPVARSKYRPCIGWHDSVTFLARGLSF